MMRVKGSERRQFFIFRLNSVLYDSYQVDETVMEIKEWKQKVPSNYVKVCWRNQLYLEKTVLYES